jgi:caffeoyl-CoA O-methyltransferase
MGREGHITALDSNAEYTATAQRYWQEAELAETIELRLGDARSTLAELQA